MDIMKQIQLTQGKTAKVDDCDFDRLNQVKWYALKVKNTFYAARKLTIDGKKNTILMHHIVIGFPPKGLETDHKDGSGLNNQKENLRHITHRQNLQNLKHVKKSSEYPGVYWDKSRKKWNARIKINGKSKNLGRFTTELAAFAAYKKAVNELGEELLQES